MNSCSAGVLQLIRRRKLKAIIASPAALSEFAHVVFPIIAVVTNNPLWTIYTLFEIMMWEGSRTVIDAIVINVGKLMRALILGLLLIYTWMIDAARKAGPPVRPFIANVALAVCGSEEEAR